MGIEDWLLSAAERGNPATALDAGRPDGQAWSTGNLVRPLVHGATYFAELRAAVDRMRRGDLLLFVDWRGDPDERLTGEDGSEVSRVFAAAAERGVTVYGLIWRSHLDRFQFSAQENRHLGEDIEAAGGCCVLDMRVRVGGSHHQKFVVLRHPGRPELDVAFLGGIDLCHSRRDDITHRGDPQPQPMAAVYGKRPPWHDVQLAITGPAVADVETVFRERWDDPQPLTANPVHRLADLVRRDSERRAPLPAPLRPPAPTGPHVVQLLRTYPQRIPRYAFAPHGERSVARGYLKALRNARWLIYLEDQYLWSREVATCIADALRANPDLHLVAVLPHFPDQDGRALPPNLSGRNAALEVILPAARERVGLYGVENHAGTPVYVHAKVCVVDDTWATVGSDNFNRRSWTHDSELTAAIWDDSAAFAAELRTTLAAEHLDLDQAGAVTDPAALFDAFRDSAATLQRWHDSGRVGARPPGRLRPLAPSPLPLRTRLWAGPLARLVYDPDGRRPRDRWRNRY
ncbi:MAG TPA: phospholipase D family protein [Jatrophihabitans sp.]|nr:phospholipase D family protein [Jatrophihabitans sp.]